MALGGGEDDWRERQGPSQSDRESERERERESVCERERETVCVCVRERESVCVCERERETGRQRETEATNLQGSVALGGGEDDFAHEQLPMRPCPRRGTACETISSGKVSLMNTRAQ